MSETSAAVRRFAELESHFERLSELAADEQRAEIDELAALDPELASEVAQLLAAGDSTWRLGQILPDPLQAATASLAIGSWGQAVDEKLMPERIGAFTIERELGRGGMGVVYLGVRADDFRQKVAIKVVKRGMDTDEILARLRHERRILATLQHPNIARLVDGGSTEDGRPFFAMEYVEGESLLAYCATRRLEIKARLQLFLDVCAAVDHAHRNLIVHRDLKPSNILVNQDGQVKLLDFGIAKVLAPEIEQRTATGLLLLTPDFASPEQIRGEALTTATDVYSLGIILCCLLTGRHPYSERIRGLNELLRFAADPGFPKPSVLAFADGAAEAGLPQGAPALARRLRGDLDTIVAMATRPEPIRRYPSVAALAEDLRRHLAFLPVAAHPEDFSYLVGRFVRRRRKLVAGGALLLTSLTLGVAGTLWQAHQAETAREHAEAEARLARTVSDYLIEIFGEPDPGKHLGQEPKARDLLQRGRERLKSLENQPELHATLAMVIGQASQKLGDHGEAVELYRHALSQRQALAASGRDLIEARLYLADALGQLNRLDEAEALLIEALAEKAELDANPLRRADIENELGTVRYRRHDFIGARPALESALATRRAARARAETAQTLNNLAAVALAERQSAQAADLMQEALATWSDLRGSDHPETLQSRANLAAVLWSLGRTDETLKETHALIEVQRRVYGGAHAELGRSLHNLAFYQLHGQDPANALTSAREAAAMLETILGSAHPDFLGALVGQARARRALGDQAGALADFDRVLALVDPQAPPAWLETIQRERQSLKTLRDNPPAG